MEEIFDLIIISLEGKTGKRYLSFHLQLGATPKLYLKVNLDSTPQQHSDIIFHITSRNCPCTFGIGWNTDEKRYKAFLSCSSFFPTAAALVPCVI